MNYYDARERLGSDGKGTGVFDYTCMNDGRTWPVGYCRSWKRDAERPSYFNEAMWQEHVKWMDKEEANGHAAKHHADGHRTKEEAYECYKQYELDHYLRLDVSHPDEQHKCEICGAWTMKAAQVGNFQTWELCDEHRNREQVEKLFSVGYAMSSY